LFLSPSITNNPIVRISYFHSKDNIANINRNVKRKNCRPVLRSSSRRKIQRINARYKLADSG